MIATVAAARLVLKSNAAATQRAARKGRLVVSGVVDRRGLCSSAPLPIIVGEEQAKLGTEAWIRKWVMKQGMCPFAAKSSYKVVPWCGDMRDDFESFIEAFNKEVFSLLENIENYTGSNAEQMPNTLFVLPNCVASQDQSLFLQVYRDMSDPDNQNRDIICGPYHLLYDDSECPIVMQMFHPENDNSIIENDPSFEAHTIIARSCEESTRAFKYTRCEESTRAFKYTLRSPWPTLHLMASADLKKAWGDDDSVSRAILLSNALNLASIGTKELDRKLQSFRNVLP